MIRQFSVLTLLLATATALSAAEIDTVTRKSDGKVIGGEITKVTKTEVVVSQKVGNKEDAIPANDIAALEWRGEPTQLLAARSDERSGNLSEALASYQEALSDASITRKEVKADIEFLIARTAVKVAQADREQAGAAIQKLKAFVELNRDHYRFYEAQILLADLALISGDSAQADASYLELEGAPWLDYQLAGQNGQGYSKLNRGDTSGARTIFDKVAQTKGTNPEEEAQRLTGMIGQAECLQEEGKCAEAVKILEQVIDGARAEDSRILARAYLRMGDCLSTDSQNLKSAVLAYLHVDVIPSLAKHGDLHAEALYQLSKLWLAVNQPQRVNDAISKLQTDYPTSEWTKKLAQ